MLHGGQGIILPNKSINLNLGIISQNCIQLLFLKSFVELFFINALQLKWFKSLHRNYFAMKAQCHTILVFDYGANPMKS